MLIAVIIIAVLLLAFAGGLYWAYRKTFAPPPRGSSEVVMPPINANKDFRDEIQSRAAQLAAKPCEFMTTRAYDGIVLSARYYHRADGAPLAICFHGYRGSAVRDFSMMGPFLMELGKGYAFVARQQHIRTDAGNDYFIDLVFYNYILKCFVLIDLKTTKISYQDVGQMDMYLQIYDEERKQPDDNPTVGIILCSETDGDVARYSTLAKNDQLYAAKYKLCLPTQEELRREIERQKEIFQMEKGGNKET